MAKAPAVWSPKFLDLALLEGHLVEQVAAVGDVPNRQECHAQLVLRHATTHARRVVLLYGTELGVWLEDAQDMPHGERLE